MTRIRVIAAMMLGICVNAVAADFAQWRGPGRNGVVPDSTRLADSWANEGPARLWTSEEEVPGSQGFGYGCVSVAGGRAFLYVNWKYKVPIQTRTVSEQALRQLGWSDKLPPETMLKAIEAARLDADLAKLVGKPRSEWIAAYVATTMPAGDDKERKQFAGFATDRLNRGAKALDLEVLARLGTIKAREFASAEEFEKWLTDNVASEDVRKAVIRLAPTYIEKANDTVLCLDGQTGKTVWKREIEGRPDGWGASGTPAVADGRVYFTASTGEIHCLDAAKGEKLWSCPAGKGLLHSSVLVAGGKVYAQAGQLLAVDAGTGQVVWKQPKVGGANCSPMLARVGQADVLVCSAGGKLHGVDPATGQLIWSVAGGAGSSSPVIAGDVMVSHSSQKELGLVAYRLAPATQPEKLWNKPEIAGGDTSPLVAENHIYLINAAAVSCIALADGSIVWQEKIKGNGEPSPIVADGKLFALIGKELQMIRLSPAKFELLGKAIIGPADYTSPALADGKLYIRLAKSVACYDLVAGK